MADTITINDIHVDTKRMDVTVNIEGQNYAKVVPLLALDDDAKLKQQLKDLATELKTELDALKAQDAANAAPKVSDAVNALVGQAIPLDDTTAAAGGTDTTQQPAGTDQGTTGQDQSTSTASQTQPQG